LISLVTRLKKDLHELTEMDVYGRRLNKLERDVARVDKSVQEMLRELDKVSRKTMALTRKGAPRRRKSLISIVEEILIANGGGPMKVTEIKKILLKDKKLKTRAKNFYAVITVSLNNSDKFKKTGPGEYKLARTPKK
jgi:hypothetical protein